MTMACPDCGGSAIESTTNPFTIDSTQYIAKITRCRSCGFYVVNVHWSYPDGRTEYAGWTKYMTAPQFLASSEALRRAIDG